MSTEEVTRILICMDGSKYCNYAFDWYLNHIKKPNDYIILFSSAELDTVITMPMAVGAAGLLTTMIVEEKAHSDKYLETLKAKMKEAGLHGKVKQTSGSPRTEILRVAEEENVDLIITGSRGMGTIKRTFLGSVSDHVLHHAHVPVLICRHKEDHDQHQHGAHAQTEVKV